jgi:hypothetical protein
MRGLAFFSFLCISTSTFAEQLICQGHLRNKNIVADLIVEQRCILDNAKISGNIQVKNNASLILKRSQVGGNISAHDYFSGVHIEETAIHGDLNIRAGREVSLIKNQVQGDIDIQNNIGSILLRHNHSQMLICIHNRIAPLGQNNQAQQKLEQCQAL